VPTLPRILAIMGSGETAPTMVSTHQELFERLPGSASAALLETPYGFQENADEISERAETYFARNVGHGIGRVGLRHAADAGTPAGDADVARLQAADYVFAGPGSPTYALDQWRRSAVVDVLRGKLRTGGVVVFASAAACGLGRWAVPVYEIYKVGARPHWVEGLDLLADLGLDAAVIPHFDNAEGGTHDTRFCYLGARRLRTMEEQLDPGATVIGVDEHTALLLDLHAGTATVRGRGQVTIRRDGVELRTVAAGLELPIAELTAAGADVAAAPAGPAALAAPAAGEVPAAATSRTLSEQVEASTADFDAALARGDADGAAAAVLELEAAITTWTADTAQSDEADRARSALRGLIVRLAQAAADGLADPTERFAPLIDTVVDARAALRERRDFALADGLRDAAAAAGVELRDTPDGTTWHPVAT
jgi:cyanophycinase-like exopeptidase